MRGRGDPCACAAYRREADCLRGARPGPLRANRGRLPGPGRGPQSVDGAPGMGARVPALLDGLCTRRAGGTSCETGLWRGDFVPPWRWRKGERIEGAASKSGKSTGGGCRIKGNISRKGVRIYHAPGGQSYNQTRINTSKGERWFCSESEARAAGWRKARR